MAENSNPETGGGNAPRVFADVKIGQTFDFISPDRLMNSFFDECVKVSARKYRSLATGREIRVGSIRAKVYHVGEYDVSLSAFEFIEPETGGSEAPRELTPYQTIKATGEKSWFHSPDGFVKIEEFENGARYLHSPLIEYPVRMSNWK
jgi:hypothetical protein